MGPTAYIVCATPRSGSTLLCDLLTDCGVAGRPNSFYRQVSIADWIEQWGLTEPKESAGFDRAYFDAARAAGSSANGMFGMRMMWDSVAYLSARLEKLFPGRENDAVRYEAAFGRTVYVHLSRRDLVAQAVSRYRAEQSGLWHLHADGSERERVKTAPPPQFNRAAIASYVAEAETDNRSWETWFKTNRIAPLRLTYEMLDEDPVTAIGDLLSALGQDRAHVRHVSPRTRRIANEQSAQWVDRFNATNK